VRVQHVNNLLSGVSATSNQQKSCFKPRRKPPETPWEKDKNQKDWIVLTGRTIWGPLKRIIKPHPSGSIRGKKTTIRCMVSEATKPKAIETLPHPR